MAAGVRVLSYSVEAKRIINACGKSYFHKFRLTSKKAWLVKKWAGKTIFTEFYYLLLRAGFASKYWSVQRPLLSYRGDMSSDSFSNEISREKRDAIQVYCVTSVGINVLCTVGTRSVFAIKISDRRCSYVCFPYASHSRCGPFLSWSTGSVKRGGRHFFLFSLFDVNTDWPVIRWSPGGDYGCKMQKISWMKRTKKIGATFAICFIFIIS